MNAITFGRLRWLSPGCHTTCHEDEGYCNRHTMNLDVRNRMTIWRDWCRITFGHLFHFMQWSSGNTSFQFPLKLQIQYSYREYYKCFGYHFPSPFSGHNDTKCISHPMRELYCKHCQGPPYAYCILQMGTTGFYTKWAAQSTSACNITQKHDQNWSWTVTKTINLPFTVNHKLQFHAHGSTHTSNFHAGA